MTEEMKKKLDAIEIVEPDADDTRMIAEAEVINDDSVMSLETFKESN